ncbi:oxygen-independent coproporphyrinogen III oxidase [Niastella caeni]|uniref:Coproporphyrinogen-III oxidase n=1 Tax=Niastella caeni TaxID=2569763 RepID=A0A4S8HBE4_9BACT|nr:oxygen-independent coproporphyrinogen III oxidase [Niastella caeni]THU30724.1 oxygen-independent coproporphyrinogen III oxidase [Niastella caeni]
MRHSDVNPLLVARYNTPVPRYTSYPTVPFWDNNTDGNAWEAIFRKRFHEQNHVNGLSLYIHLPFCESLCTYCGCNKKITTNHQVEEEYIAALEKEWGMYRAMMGETPVIRELHFGGGTPTFFSPGNLERLLQFIFKGSIVHPQHEFSIEGHPNNTTVAHLKKLASLGFKRISYGVQDNDPEVQRIINRIQPFENVKRVTSAARSNGFTSVNFDLIYGLPLQTIESIERTIQQVLQLMPDRIAFYSYAHVPWTSKAQRLFDETHLPDAATKLQLYLTGKQLLLQHGYYDIGMDHFALPHDDLYKAKAAGTLNRNFMGYTTQNTGLLLGLGVSAISDAGYAYAQNDKALHNYYAAIQTGQPAIHRGHLLTEEDLDLRKYILEISCRSKTIFRTKHLPLLREYVFPRLHEMAADGLVCWNERELALTQQGQHFIRNVCSAFDLRMHKSEAIRAQLFSKGV